MMSTVLSTLQSPLRVEEQHGTEKEAKYRAAAHYRV
jgi:hypothetical protein